MAVRTAVPANERSRVPALSSTASGVTLPFIDASPRFVLGYHPERWMVLDGRLVPSLAKTPLVAGVNHVEIDRNGRIQFARRRAQMEEGGWTVIPFEWAPDGVSYLQVVDTRPDGTKTVAEAWLSVWESVDAGAKATTPDDAAYADWLRSLVDEKKLPECRINVALRMRDAVMEKLEKARGEAAKLDGHGKIGIRVKALEEEYRVLEEFVSKTKPARVTPRKAPAPQLDAAPEETKADEKGGKSDEKKPKGGA